LLLIGETIRGSSPNYHALSNQITFSQTQTGSIVASVAAVLESSVQSKEVYGKIFYPFA
jgi:hypothetical protein